MSIDLVERVARAICWVNGNWLHDCGCVGSCQARKMASDEPRREMARAAIKAMEDGMSEHMTRYEDLEAERRQNAAAEKRDEVERLRAELAAERESVETLRELHDFKSNLANRFEHQRDVARAELVAANRRFVRDTDEILNASSKQRDQRDAALARIAELGARVDTEYERGFNVGYAEAQEGLTMREQAALARLAQTESALAKASADLDMAINLGSWTAVKDALAAIDAVLKGTGDE